MTNAKVDLIDVALRGCRSYALFLPNTSSETTVVATRCEFANSAYGAALHVDGWDCKVPLIP